MTGQFLKLCIDGLDLDGEEHQFLPDDVSSILLSIHICELCLTKDYLLCGDLEKFCRSYKNLSTVRYFRNCQVFA